MTSPLTVLIRCDHFLHTTWVGILLLMDATYERIESRNTICRTMRFGFPITDTLHRAGRLKYQLLRIISVDLGIIELNKISDFVVSVVCKFVIKL